MSVKSSLRRHASGSARVALSMMVLLAAPALGAMPQPAAAQSDVSITVMQPSGTIGSVMKAVEQQTGLHFFYNDRDINLSEPLHLELTDASLDKVLAAFHDKGLSCEVRNGLIVLSRASKHSQSKTITIKGKVVDASGEPIMSATVVVLGADGKGAFTDMDGNFEIKDVPADATLRITFVGMTPQEIALNGRTDITITLHEDSELLEEVVVVGYGTQKKVNVVGSIAQVRGDDLTKKSSANLVNALTGMMSGVTVTQRSGAPGKESNSIRVRGIGSFGGSPNPLVLVDGIPGSISDVNSSDVESVSVLKDASTAAIYGSRAANGVILITTKKGKGDKVNLSYNGYIGWNSPTALPEFVPTWEYAKLLNEATGTPTYSEEEIASFRNGSNKDLYAQEDYLHSLFKSNAPQTNHHITINGRTDRMSYYASLGALYQDGLISKNYFTRYDGRTNFTINLSDNLSISANLHALLSERNEPTTPGGEDVESMEYIILKALRFPGIKPTKLSTGEYGLGPEMHGTPLAWIESKSFANNRRFSARTNVSLSYKPIKELEMKVIAGMNHNNSESKQFRSSITLQNGLTPGASSLNDQMVRDFYKTLQSTVNYTSQLGEHGLSALLGYSYEDYSSRYVGAERDKLASNDLPYINVGSPDNQKGYGGGTEWAMQSVFGRLDYNYASKYLLEITGRYDGSSRFSSHKRYAFFPSAALGWRVSEEDFFKSCKSLEWISNLKFKVSLGVLGNQEIGVYPYQTVYDLGLFYPFGNTLHQGAAVTKSTDENLSWESTRTWDAGFESSILNGALTLNVNYFSRTTYDILFAPGGSVSKVSGLKVSPINTGTLTNKGIEVEIGHQYVKGDFSYNLTGNFTYIDNRIKSLGVGDVKQLNGLVGSGNLFIGHPIDIYYGYKTDGVFTDQEDINAWANQKKINPKSVPGDIRYKDLLGPEGKPDGVVDPNYDRTVLGSSIPKYTFSLSGGMGYKGVDFTMQLQGVAGVKGYLNNFAGYAFFQEGNIQRWQADNRFRPDQPDRYAKYPRLEAIPGTGTANTEVSDYWLRDASYLRIKNVQIGYTLPKQWLPQISSLRLYLSGDNLYTFNKYPKGWDPEINTGGAFYPILRTITFGLNFSL